MQTVIILGRQPELGLAELESLYGAERVKSFGRFAAVVDHEPTQIDFGRLGGAVKLCKLLTELDDTKWDVLHQYLEETIPKHLSSLPEGKLRLGLSTYGINVNTEQLTSSGLVLKRMIKAAGRSVRYVPNTGLALTSAQILHNQLTSQLGWELVFVSDGNKTLLAQNMFEQDIEAYGRRDQARPKRDARVGMLPPKLAQIIVNLATGLCEISEAACGPGEPKHKILLDPFCGTGVLLQEALLMGYEALGSDLEPRMIEYTEANLKWLGGNLPKWKLEAGDATDFQWPSFDILASETYLGRPFSSLPQTIKLDEVIKDVDTIHRKFLKNLAGQTTSGFRLCLALPAWKTPRGFMHLPMLDRLTDMGYTRAVFVHAGGKDLIYHREGQIVGRELVVLIRK